MMDESRHDHEQDEVQSHADPEEPERTADGDSSEDKVDRDAASVDMEAREEFRLTRDIPVPAWLPKGTTVTVLREIEPPPHRRAETYHHRYFSVTAEGPRVAESVIVRADDLETVPTAQVIQTNAPPAADTTDAPMDTEMAEHTMTDLDREL